MSEAITAIQQFLDKKLDKAALIDKLAAIKYKDPSYMAESAKLGKAGRSEEAMAVINGADPHEPGTFDEVKAAWAMEKLPSDVYYAVLERLWEDPDRTPPKAE